MDKNNYKILGVDPGTNLMGYGIIQINNKKYELVCAGVVHLDHLKEHSIKLKHIFERITVLIQQYHPKEFAIEAPFFGVNVQSMLKLGRAQGAAMCAASSKNLNVYEYSPKRVKQSITGNGNASKEQVFSMVKQLLKVKQNPSYFDATDALAVAICHFFQASSSNKNNVNKNYNSWSAFLKDNPQKMKK